MATAEVRTSGALAPAQPAAPPQRRRWPPVAATPLVVGLVTSAAAVLYFTLGLLAYRRFTVGSYDLVIFDQAIRSYADLGLPVSIVKGVHNDFGPGFHILGDHFSPILALLAPLYWIYDHPVMLIAAEAVLFAAAIPIVWSAARRMVGVKAAYAVAVVFALGWPLQVASAKGFHEVAFAVPLTALALERVLAGRYRQAAFAAAALLLVKEDMGLLVAGIGLLIAWRARQSPRARTLGFVLVAAGIAMVILAVQVFIPLAGGRSDYYWFYDQLGSGPLEALGHVVLHPLDTLSIAITPERKWQMMLWLLAPLLLLPLRSPVTLLAIPFLAERVFSTNPNHWGADQHYDAFVWPILVLAAVDALHAIRTRAAGQRRSQLAGAMRWAARAWVPLALAATAWITLAVDRFQPWDLSSGHHGSQDRNGAAAAVLRWIPDGATVEADNELGPHLTRRAIVLLFDEKPRGAEWVIADTKQTSHPWRQYEPQRQRIAELVADGDYELVAEFTGYLVFHRVQ